MSLLTDLEAVLGAEAVTPGPDAGSVHDLSTRALVAERLAGSATGTPVAVVRPTSANEVGAIAKWANSTRTPLVPAGGRSGVCGGVTSMDGSVVVDLQRLDQIVDVDQKSLLVTAQAGVFGDTLERELNARGLTLGHAPQSIEISTVGGWLATRASGQLSARYGGIENLVVGMEVVLPSGDPMEVRTGPRRSTGPDLAGLFIGSEGALGIITSATLRVSKLPTARVDRCFRFEHMDEGVAACRTLAQGHPKPLLVRLYDADDAAIFWRDREPVPDSPVLLVSSDGGAREELELGGAQPAPDEIAAYWWEHRNDAAAHYESLMGSDGILGPHPVIDTMEVSGTWTVLRHLYHSMKASLSEIADIAGCHLSHVYPDGACLYFTLVSMCESDEDALEQHERWWDAGMTACLAAGGMISHHHGIGRLKARWMPEQLGGGFEILQALKRELDPNNIMNPGVLGL